MTNHEPETLASGESRSRHRQRRVWRALLIPAAVALLVLFAARSSLDGAAGAPGGTSPAFAITFVVVIALFTIVGAIWHHRVIDEQEERAILWGNTVGFYTAIVLAMSADVLAMAGLVGRHSHVAVLAGALGASLCTYLWHRYR